MTRSFRERGSLEDDMIILGLSALDTDSTATLFIDGKIEGAIAEERLSRKKLQNGFPRRALGKLLDDHGVRPADIDVVAYPFFEWQQEGALISKHYAQNMAETTLSDEPIDKLPHFFLFAPRPTRRRRMFLPKPWLSRNALLIPLRGSKPARFNKLRRYEAQAGGGLKQFDRSE